MRDEEWWKEAKKPGPMLHFLKDYIGFGVNRQLKDRRLRKLRLFCCACCRRIWHLVQDDRSRQAVERAEQFADNQSDRNELAFACEAAKAVVTEIFQTQQGEWSTWAIPSALSRCAAVDPSNLGEVSGVFSTVAFIVAGNQYPDGDFGPEAEAFRRAQAEELEKLADLLRHIWGPPDTSLPRVSTIAAIRDLAEAVYQQDRSAVGPLHDALLDAGFIDLADHFRDPAAWHPKGCWAVDLLTGRE